MDEINNSLEVSLSLNTIQNYIENISACLDIGNYYSEKNRYKKASIKYKKALEISLIGIINYGEELKFVEYEDESRNKLYTSLINHGAELYRNKKYEESLDFYLEALDINSKKPDSYYRLGECFHELKNNDLAIKYLNKSLAIDPDFSETYRVLGDVYYALNEYKKAIDYYDEFTLLDDTNEYVYNMLGHLHYKSCDIRKALLYFKLAIDINPHFKIAFNNFLYATVKMPDFTQEEIYNLATNTSSLYLDSNFIQDDKIFIHEKRKKDKKIKIAYLSGDIKAHVVMNYILPILRNHNRDEFEINAYYNNDNDWLTTECKKYFDNFIQIKELEDEDTAKLIYNDKIDILIDLSGHTAYNRVFVMAYKPAPIQVTYVGYPNTTGIDKIDYFLTNENLNSPEDDKFFSENLYFMNNSYRCFDYHIKPKYDLLTIPYFKNNYITFGVFNDLSKINDDVLEVWGEILKNKENSKLLICRDSIIKEYYYKKFSELGIGQERIILRENFSLNVYNEVDIHLDTFPFSGVTVIFDSVTMGVPVITLKDKMFQGREAANININLGLSELVANTKEEYILKALDLSNNIKRLKYLKSNLPTILKDSVFYKHKEFTKSLEDCYKDMYSKICN